MVQSLEIFLHGFALRDRSRRAVGQIFDQAGWGPIETPSRVEFSEPGVTLKSYGGVGPALLLVPAPIKRAYIWDLAPWCSVVGQALRGNCRVYVLEWREPGGEAQGLADYADRLIGDCVDAIEAQSGARRLFLAGHSLGGTLAAIFSSLHTERVQGLILLAAPLHFAYGADVFAPLVAGLPIQRWPSVPGSFLNAITLAAAPLTIGCAPWLDRFACGFDGDAMNTLLRVERWTLDELPLPGRLVTDVVQRLYRDNAFLHGTLTLGDRRAAPEHFTAPLLSVIDARCSLVPPQSVEPFHRAVRSPDTRLLHYRGDTGVLLQHVGMLVGRSAHQHLWPEILRWIHAHAPLRPPGPETPEPRHSVKKQE